MGRRRHVQRRVQGLQFRSVKVLRREGRERAEVARCRKTAGKEKEKFDRLGTVRRLHGTDPLFRVEAFPLWRHHRREDRHG